MYKTYNDLVFALAKRAKELANLKMDDLRATAGYNCSTRNEALEAHKHEDRGTVIEYILAEEFVEEFDKEIESCS